MALGCILEPRGLNICPPGPSLFTCIALCPLGHTILFRDLPLGRLLQGEKNACWLGKSPAGFQEQELPSVTLPTQPWGDPKGPRAEPSAVWTTSPPGPSSRPSPLPFGSPSPKVPLYSLVSSSLLGLHPLQVPSPFQRPCLPAGLASAIQDSPPHMEKQKITYKGVLKRPTTDFSAELCRPEGRIYLK